MESNKATTVIKTDDLSNKSVPPKTVIIGRRLIKENGKNKPHLSSRPLILVINRREKHCRDFWIFIALGLFRLFIGAVNMTVMVYSVHTGDIHASICTVAFHFFSAEAILGLNYANGWSAPMRLRDRRFAHVFLQICGMGCAITGIVLILLSKGYVGTAHGIAGLITAGFTGLSLLTGPCALFGKRYLKITHIAIGMPTFLVSSICLCLGFLTDAFTTWATYIIVYILLGFVICYTTFIVISVFVKFTKRF